MALERELTPRLTKIRSYYKFFEKGLHDRGFIGPVHEISMRDIMILHHDIMSQHPDFEAGEDNYSRRYEHVDKAASELPVTMRWVKPKPFETDPEKDARNVNSKDLTHRILCERAVSRALAGGRIRPKDVRQVKILLSRFSSLNDEFGNIKAAFDELTTKVGQQKMVELADEIRDGIKKDLNEASELSAKALANQSQDPNDAKIVGAYHINALHETIMTIMALDAYKIRLQRSLAKASG